MEKDDTCVGEHFPPVTEIPVFLVAFPCLSIIFTIISLGILEIYSKVASAKGILKRWGANDLRWKC